MDLTDAVIYVKKLNVPAGMVGACRLDVAYEHFRVKAANKLLKSINQSQKSRRKKVNGVPVFAAPILNIAMATNDGIRCQMDYSSSEDDSSLKTSPILTKKKNKNTTTLQFPIPQPLPFKTAYQTPKQYIKSPI